MNDLKDAANAPLTQPSDDISSLETVAPSVKELTLQNETLNSVNKLTVASSTVKEDASSTVENAVGDATSAGTTALTDSSQSPGNVARASTSSALEREQRDAKSAQSDAKSSTPWLRKTDGAEIKNELRDISICGVCASPIPIDATHCPQCGKFAPKHRELRKYKKGDVDRLLAEIVAHYEPRTIILKETSEHLAKAFGELKTTPAGSLEWHRILNITQELTDRLDRSRRPAVDDDTAARRAALDAMTDAQFINHLLKMRNEIDTLIDMLTPLNIDTAAMSAAYTASLSVQAEVEAREPKPASTSALAPQPCPYCHQTLCVGRSHHSYDALHAQDAEHLDAQHKKRIDEALTSLALEKKGFTRRW